MQYSSPEVDRLLSQALIETEILKRINLYREAERKVLEDAPMIPWVYLTYEIVFQPYVKGLEIRFIRDLLGCDDVRAGWDRGSSSTKLHIRIYWTPACGSLKGLPPTQTRVIPGCQGKTPGAQMHFASEFRLSQASHSINGQKMTIQANPGGTIFIIL